MYDKIAISYLENRINLKSGKYLKQLLKFLPKRSLILDLGCGAGVPVDDILLKAGHQVIGIDISPRQIANARKYCPGGEYLVGDIGELKTDEYQAQAIVCFYTIFHIQRSRQSELLRVMGSYLPSGGMLLITMGDREFEGEHMMHGESMWASQYGTAKNRAMVETAGFDVILDEVDTSGGERHQVIMGVKL